MLIFDRISYQRRMSLRYNQGTVEGPLFFPAVQDVPSSFPPHNQELHVMSPLDDYPLQEAKHSVSSQCNLAKIVMHRPLSFVGSLLLRPKPFSTDQ